MTTALPTLHTFRRYVNDPNTAEVVRHHKFGKKVEIIGEVDPNTYDFDRYGVMYQVRFSDGFLSNVFPREIGL